MNFRPDQARVPEALLAAGAVLAASWPLSNLLEEGGWLPPVILLLAIVVAIGCGGRYVGVSPWLTALVQVVAVLLGTAILRLGDHLSPSEWSTLPGAVEALFANAVETLTTYAAPAPLSSGVLFLLTLCLPLVGVVTDLLNAGLRMAAAAGLPVLAVFLCATSNTAEALNPMYFLALGGIWLGMLLQQSLRTMRAWSSTESFARTPEHHEDRLGLGSFSATARWISALALVLAVLLPTVIPHLPTMYFAEGLANRGQSQTASVGFTDSLDLSQDLNNEDQSPILTYATTATSPAPLKVLTTSTYQDGNWSRDESGRRVDGSDGAEIPDPVGLDSETDRSLERINVVGNSLELPYLATPWPVQSADLGDRGWSYAPVAGLPRAEGPTPDYSVTYEVIESEARPIDGAATPNLPSSVLEVPDRARPAVERAVADATADLDSEAPFDQAIAFQEWLRDPDEFTYSLTLASRRTGEDGRPLDPLSNFLATRRGYCTQFATAMVMMARSQGIPARVAIGFLPGTETDKGFEVRASDAHAWPELFFPGMGWTRFEPTPGTRSGEVPSYTLPLDSAQPTPNQQGRPEDRTTTSSAPAPSVQPTQEAAPQPAPTATAQESILSSPWLWWTLLALVLGGAGVAVTPLAARWRREQDRRAARLPQERVEAEWAGLQSRLHDLGIEGPGERSPRDMEQHYRHRAPLETPGKEALHRATQTLERARYAPPEHERRSGIDDDVDHIVREVRDQSSWPTRMSARWFPHSGRAAIGGAVAKTLGAPFRAIRRRSDPDQD